MSNNLLNVTHSYSSIILVFAVATVSEVNCYRDIYNNRDIYGDNYHGTNFSISPIPNMLNKNTLGVKRCEAKRSSIVNESLTKALISGKAKKFN